MKRIGKSTMVTALNRLLLPRISQLTRVPPVKAGNTWKQLSPGSNRFALPRIPYEATLEDVASGCRPITAMSGYVAWLPLHSNFRSSDMARAEDHLVWTIRSYYFEDFLNQAISAQHDAMTFSAAGYQLIADKFQPVFDSTRIKVPFQRLNY
jgi:hypothetical protein